jgi:hypothetical protein
MTATSGSGAQQAPASPQVVPPTTADQPGSEAERRRELLLALTTEHFTLQTARTATISDSNGRSALYLSTVSSAVVALAFIGQVARVGEAFFLFALALLPALVLLGVLTYLRLLQTAIEDLFYARAINRIRRHYVDIDPDAARWFLLSGYDDPPGVMANHGVGHARGCTLAPAPAVTHGEHGRRGHKHHRRGVRGAGCQRCWRRSAAGGRQCHRGDRRHLGQRSSIRMASDPQVARRRKRRPEPVPLLPGPRLHTCGPPSHRRS